MRRFPSRGTRLGAVRRFLIGRTDDGVVAGHRNAETEVPRIGVRGVQLLELALRGGRSGG